ncbi:MAG: hypothetical protein E7240_00860 [Lachnospiraceae bacterium]|nr:hypothetical protein [Lachnospiraceae bacterium]
MSSVKLQFQNRAAVSFQEIVLAMLAAALCTAGAAAALVPVFPHIPGSWGIYALIGAVLTAAFCFLLYMPVGRRLTLIVSGAVLLIFAVRFRAFRNGMLVLGNDFQEFLTGRTGRIHLYFRTQGNAGSILVPALYLILISIISATSQRRGKRFPMILLALSAVAMIFGFPVSPWSVLLLAAAAVIGVQNPNSFTIRSPRRGFLSALIPAAFALAAVGILFFIGYLVAGTEEFRTAGAVDGIHRKIHEFRYERGGRIAMPEGDLRSYEPPENETDPLLTIKMSHPEKLYLRGFTAEVFENDIWRSCDSDAYIENAPLFYTLHENAFYGQKMIASAAEAAGWEGASSDSASPEKPSPEKDSSEKPSSDHALSEKATPGEDADQSAVITIKNENICRKYRFLPYAMKEQDLLDPLAIGDAGALTEHSAADPDTTEIQYLPGSIPEWYEIGLALVSDAEDTAGASDVTTPSDGPAGAGADSAAAGGESAGSIYAPASAFQYLRLEQAYYDSVLKQDRQLPPDAASECAALFGEEPKERKLSDILALVHETLENSKYEDTYHYASAAALMLRYLGVPARYVEGFLLTAEEAAEIGPEEEAALTAANTHAWAEFYLRGIGWIPFEATPGYRDNEEISRIAILVEKSRNASGEAPIFAQTEIVYTSGIYDTAAPYGTAGKMHFRWKWWFWLIPAGAAAEVMLVWIIFEINERRRQYKKAMATIRAAREEGRFPDAVALEYAYARRLMKEADIQDPPGLARMQRLNEEAVFSDHALTEENAREAEAFTQNIITECKRKWSLRERLYHRWVNGII